MRACWNEYHVENIARNYEHGREEGIKEMVRKLKILETERIVLL